MKAHTTHEQTQVTCFLTAEYDVQAITQACGHKKRGLCHQLNKSQKLDLSKPESACALQHHRSNVTTPARSPLLQPKTKRFTDAIVSVYSAAPPQQRHAVAPNRSSQAQQY